jgi:hypothetical protein
METYRYIIGYVDGRTAFNSDEIGKKNIDKLPKRVPIVVTTEGENWKGLMFEGILQYSQLKDKYNVQIMTKSIDGIEITYQSYIQNIIN